MKRLYFLLSAWLCLAPLNLFAQRTADYYTDSIWKKDIKSVYINRNGVELAPAIIHIESNERILLRFDQLAEQPENYRYHIYHCNADWQIDDLEPYEYIQGFEEDNITNYLFSFTTLTRYIQYRQYIPSPNTTFIASGNYLLSVFLQDNPDSIVLTRRFYVQEDLLDITVDIGRPAAATGNINRDQEVDVTFAPKDGVLLNVSPQYLRVEAQQNQRTDLVRTLPFSGYQGDSFLYRWKNENVFPGGNCFRYFDLSNLRTPMYNIQQVESFGGEIFAFLKPDEIRALNSFTLNQTLNGGMKTNIFDRNDPQLEADYVWVNFSLPMKQPFLDGNIYIVGQLTDWRLNEESQMEWQPKYHAYTKRLLLKQGYYSYLFLFKSIGSSKGETTQIEGDHNATPNDYTIYVYLRQPNDRYDRLIGVRQVLTAR